MLYNLIKLAETINVFEAKAEKLLIVEGNSSF